MDAFTERKRGLEEEYFYRKEQEQITSLRQQSARERERQAMGQKLGVNDEQLLQRLQKLGFTPATILALNLVPLVQTAWAEGRLTGNERDLLTAAAQQQGIETNSEAGLELLCWLSHRPTEEFFADALDALNTILLSLPPDEQEKRKQEILMNCRQVAKASGGVLGFIGFGGIICQEEEETLQTIVAKLNQSHQAETQ